LSTLPLDNVLYIKKEASLTTADHKGMTLFIEVGAQLQTGKGKIVYDVSTSQTDTIPIIDALSRVV
jgi:hypothetical protein